MKTHAQNKKAYHDFEILEKIEAGIVLTGQEVKSIKGGRVSIQGSYVRIRGEEAYLEGADVPAYQPANAPKDYNPKKDRKLLLTKAQLKKLGGRTREKGLTLVPLKVYTKQGLVKVEIALAKGKKRQDKREAIKKREADIRIRRVARG